MGFSVVFDRKFVRKIVRKLSEKQVKTLQNTSLKLPPDTWKLLINHPDDRICFNGLKHWFCHFDTETGWFINNFRVFGGSFREVFWKVLTCFSESFRSISRTNFRSKTPENSIKIHLKAFKAIWRSLINRPEFRGENYPKNRSRPSRTPPWSFPRIPGNCL